MYVCTYGANESVYVYIYKHVYVCVYICMCTCFCLCMCAHKYLNIQIQVVAARQNRDIAAAAAKGTSPWKLAQLSACICLWDLLWLPASTSSSSVPMDLSVTKDHVQRAFTCLEMLEGFATS